jgi:hypothetical protein
VEHSGVWFFQTNPKHYDIDGALATLGRIWCMFRNFSEASIERSRGSAATCWTPRPRLRAAVLAVGGARRDRCAAGRRCPAHPSINLPS